jgi:hypothetical protein
MPLPAHIPRRRFLALAALLPPAAVRALRAAPAPGHCAGHASPHRRRARGPHPAPRPGVDASKVVPRDRLAADPEAAAVFDLVRQIPQVVDGIRCACGCASIAGFRSLLSCFEGDGMARACEICQGQARLAHELHAAGRPLAVIRLAVDRRF